MSATNSDRLPAVIAVMAFIQQFTDTERDQFFQELRAQFCLHCGAQDPKCQCWNDE